MDLSWKDDPFEVQDAGSCFLKLWRESFSLKQTLFEGVLKIGFMTSFEEEGEYGSILMAINEDLDHDFLLKIDLMLIIVSP